VRDAGADIAGVRGAACVGGRSGTVAADRVRLLRRVVRGVHHEDTKLAKMHEN